MRRRPRIWLAGYLVIWLSASLLLAQEKPAGQAFQFRSNTDLINVTVTVTDANGRFVPNLTRDDFVVYEDGRPQSVTQFDSDRVPVSLGIALDTSGSMAGEKIQAAQAALNKFLFDLLGKNDQVFLYRFDSQPQLIQGWTSDRAAVSRALGTAQARGGTALYDAVVEAIPLAQKGVERKKALVVISDGEDQNSRLALRDAQQLIRESEVLVYGIAIDPSGRSYSPTSPYSSGGPYSNPQPSAPVRQPSAPPRPSPFPGKKAPPSPAPSAPASARPAAAGPSSIINSPRAYIGGSAGVNALRSLTDDSGGRTEVIQGPRDLDPATAGIADELSRQYFLGYVSTQSKDGKWHQIEVQVRKGQYHVRARKGYIAG